MQPFQVFARVRPINERERQYGNGRGQVSMVNDSTIQVGDNYVFQPQSDNTSVFQHVILPLADQFLGGINTTIFAYGITGAGKSHTMFGSQGQCGIIQMVLDYLCSQLSKSESITLTMSYLQIYNQQVFDLLRNNSENLQILDDPSLGIIVADLEQRKINSAQMALELIKQGNHRRVVAQTKANQYSSRSHAIVQLGLQRQTDEGVFVSKMSLVDLAGSQKQSVYTQGKGLRNLQGSNINRSLLTLGNCITILSEKGKKGGFVPYRDSKLTRLLKDSLGGNTKTVMIACVSPSLLYQQETINTLKYATRARKIQKVIKQNIHDRRPVEQLKRQIVRLRQALEQKEMMKPRNVKNEVKQKVLELIQNVQKLTLMKFEDSTVFQDTVKQIELMDEQRNIIDEIYTLAGCNEQIENYSKNFNNIDHKLKKLPSKETLMQKMQDRGVKDMIIPLKNKAIQKENNVESKNNSFNKGYLQNKRLLCQRQRKNLRQLISQYSQVQSDFDKQEFILRAQEMLNKNKQIYSSVDIELIQMIARGDEISRQLLDQNQILRPMSFEIENGTGGGRMRFIQSLQQVQRMVKKISNGGEQLRNFEIC